MDLTIELTSSRVSKGTTLTPFIPKVRQRPTKNNINLKSEITTDTKITINNNNKQEETKYKTHINPPTKGNTILIKWQ
jgi:hypothetical protein